MKYCILFLVLFAAAAAAQNQTAEELIALSDQAAKVDFAHNEALSLLLEADNEYPDNWEILWRISRSIVDITETIPDTSDSITEMKIDTLKTALDYADRSVQLAPDKAITYVRRAIANGYLALYEGVFSSSGRVNKLKDDIDSALTLGNGGAEVQALAHYVLGRAHARLHEDFAFIRFPFGLEWGDNAIAISEYKAAIELRPDYRMFHIALAKAYIAAEDYDAAREVLYHIPDIPPQNDIDDNLLKESGVLLEQIRKK